MINLHLIHDNSHEGVYLRLPATPGEVGAAFGMLEKLGEGKVTVFDVTSPIHNICKYIINRDINEKDNLSILQQLAEAIGQMDDRERKIFAGALEAESINGLDDVLALSKCLDEYVILPNISNDIELGRFLVDSRYKDFPEDVQPYLDYRTIGAEYYADNGGAYGPGGYVRRKSSLEQEPVRRDAIITLHMATPTIYNFTVSLPATEEEMEESKYRLGVDNFVQAKIIQVEYSKSYLSDLIPRECICVEDANELALCIEEMQQRDGELLKFLAVLSVEQPETMTDVLRFAINLDDYERITEGTYEYGQSVLRRHGADNELLEVMDGYMDFEKLGEDAMVEDGVRQTEFGLVRRCSHPFPEPEPGMQMI